MKKVILSFLVLGCFIQLSAQKPEVHYFDKYWMPCSEELSENYSKSYSEEGIWIVDEYNNDDQLLQRKQYLLEDKVTKTGLWSKWYPNGQLYSETSYNEEGDRTGIYNEYYDNGQVSVKGNKKEGKSDGIWTRYYKNGNTAVQLSYEMDSLTLKKFWNRDGSMAENEISELDDIRQSYPGGVDSLVNDIYGNVHYPELARENGIEGMVVIQFFVDTDGTVKNIRLVKSVHPILDKEALRVVLTMKKWLPGKLIYEDLAISFNLPIKFKLEDDYIDEE